MTGRSGVDSLCKQYSRIDDHRPVPDFKLDFRSLGVFSVESRESGWNPKG
jgi:hypothetical protein